jgi:two-component system, NarL family, sensor histidine kinase UhpB
MRCTPLRSSASTAQATARKVLPVPAGPMPKVMSCASICAGTAPGSACGRAGRHGGCAAPPPVWYRVGFRTATPPARHELMALYIARVCSNLEVFLNGRRIHSGGHMSEPLTHNCNHPQLVVLPAALIEPGANTLDLKVVGYPATHVASLQRAGGLSALEIGPHDALARRHARETALRVGVPQAVSATLVLMGGFMFVMGWINRRESHLAYFGALSFGWAIVESRLWLRELPFPGAVAEFLLASLMPFVTLAAVQFLLRYARWRHRWIDLWLPLQCALMPTTLVLAGPARLQAMTSAWFVLLALQALAAVAFYLRRTGTPGAAPSGRWRCCCRSSRWAWRWSSWRCTWRCRCR